MWLQQDTHPYVVSFGYSRTHIRTLCPVVTAGHTSVRCVMWLQQDTHPSRTHIRTLCHVVTTWHTSVRCVVWLQRGTHPYVVSFGYNRTHIRTLCHLVTAGYTSVRCVKWLQQDTHPYVVSCVAAVWWSTGECVWLSDVSSPRHSHPVLIRERDVNKASD